jgi:glutamate synthase (NADPH/NADH) small chain
MGQLGGFLKIQRVGFDKREPRERVRDYDQYFALQPEEQLREQGARCMDCGVPFCHEGCPLGNLIPDWNDLVYRDKWQDAIVQLHATNNFPEFTGRICPAPCESACVLAINDDAVAIEQIELAIVERAYEEGWIVAEPPERRTGKTVAVVGSGPAGLAVAAELNRCGHTVTVYERDEAPGRELAGIHFAMDYLYQRNRWVAAQEGRPSRAPAPGTEIVAAGKRVVVIGGGDTGMDCISNANREGASDAMILDVYQELGPGGRDARTPWPMPPKRTATTYALEEGGKRWWGTEVTGFSGDADGNVTHVHARRVQGTSSRDLKAIPGSDFTQPADLVLIAIGFSHPEHEGLVEQLGTEYDPRGNIRTRQTYRTSQPGVYACGDARIGQALVVTAIAEGRKCARIVNQDLGGSPMDADREQLAIGAWSGIEDHTLRHEAEAAGNVRLGDDFFSGPGGTI